MILSYAKCALILSITGLLAFCNGTTHNTNVNSENTQTLDHSTDSSMVELLQNFTRTRPEFKLALDFGSDETVAAYTISKSLNSRLCSTFALNRVYLGKFNHVKAHTSYSSTGSTRLL